MGIDFYVPMVYFYNNIDIPMVHKMTKKTKSYSKTLDITRDLEQYISKMSRKGELTVPSERFLSRHFSCNRKTLRNAFLELDAKGITKKLSRQRIISLPETGITGKKTILVIAPTDTSLHDQTFSLFYEELANNDEVMLQVIDSNSNPSDITRKVKLMVEAGSDTAFVVGNNTTLNDLEQFIDKITFYRLKADDLMWDRDLPGVLVDYRYGAYIGVRHLISTGKRNILVISVKPEHHTRVFDDFERGCLKAARDADCNVNIDFFHSTGKLSFNDSINENNVLDKVGRYDACFACYDYNLVKLNNLLNAKGVVIPSDIALLGFYDTPWTTLMHPQLSSISIQDALIVKKALEMMEQKRNSVEIVKPKLIVRDSTVLN